jgi:hypothetical protein
MRVSDGERQTAAERLRVAMNEGRLDLLEYDNRIAAAYAAVTYADLDVLVADLPADPPRPAVPAPSAPAVPAGRRAVPGVLVVLWTVWAGVFGINLVVWVLVSLGNGRPDTFWPLWLLVPATVLLVVTGAVRAVRRR